MQTAAFAPEQVAGHRVAHQGVAEDEVVVALLDQQTAVDEGTQTGEEFVLAELGDRGEDVEAGRRAEDRRGLGEPPFRGGEAVELAAHDLLQAPRQGLGGELVGRDVALRADQFLQEERVAPRAFVHRRSDRGGQRPAVHGGQEGRDLGPVETVEVDPLDVVAALQAGEHVAPGEAAAEILGAVRADQQQPGGAELGETLEGFDAPGVGPVQILEGEDRTLPADEGEDRVEGLPCGGHRSGSAGSTGSEELVDDGERVGCVGGVRLAGEHRSRRRRGKLTQQARLAHPGLPADQGEDEPRLGRGAAELGEGAPAADHHRAEPDPPGEHRRAHRATHSCGRPTGRTIPSGAGTLGVRRRCSARGDRCAAGA